MIEIRNKINLPISEKEACRCGLCCVVPSIVSLQKVSGIQCGNLSVIAENELSTVTGCSKYNERPAACRSFDCSISDEYQRMKNLLDMLVLGVLEGKSGPQKMVMTESFGDDEPDRLFVGYDMDQVVRSISQPWILKHSAVTQALKNETRVGFNQQRAISALIVPNNAPMQERVAPELLENFGVAEYLKKVNADEVMQLLLWTQHKMEGSFLAGNISDPSDWNRVSYMLEIGSSLNPQMRDGAEMFIRGDSFQREFPANKDRVESQVCPKFLRRPSYIMEKVIRKSVGI